MISFEYLNGISIGKIIPLVFMFLWGKNPVAIEYDRHCNGQRKENAYQAFAFKAAESVSLSSYCMWIFLCYKKLHMTKLFLRVKLIP